MAALCAQYAVKQYVAKACIHAFVSQRLLHHQKMDSMLFDADQLAKAVVFRHLMRCVSKAGCLQAS